MYLNSKGRASENGSTAFLVPEKCLQQYVLKTFEEYLKEDAMVLGFESERSLLTAFIAVEKEHPYIKEFLDSYEK